jgi:hypothetical protein
LPLPFQADQVVVFQQGHRPQVGKTPPLNQHLEIAMQRTARAETLRGGLPLTTGPQHVKDAVDDRSPGQRRPPTHLAPTPFGQQHFDAFPHPVGHAKLIAYDFFRLHP